MKNCYGIVWVAESENTTAAENWMKMLIVLFFVLLFATSPHRSVFACGLCGVPGSSLERERKRIFLYGYDDVELDLTWEVISECHLEK